jgi:hypothetical protein
MGRRGESAAAYSVISQPNLLRSIATLVCLAHVALRAEREGCPPGFLADSLAALQSRPRSKSLRSPASAPSACCPTGAVARPRLSARSGVRRTEGSCQGARFTLDHSSLHCLIDGRESTNAGVVAFRCRMLTGLHRAPYSECQGAYVFAVAARPHSGPGGGWPAVATALVRS